MVLPILSALARKTEEEDALRRGSGRLTEIPASARAHQQRCDIQLHREMWPEEAEEGDIKEIKSPGRARM